MNQNDVRKAIDTRLSGLNLSPRMQAEIRSRAHGNAQPHMRRKLSVSLAFALLALLLAATAGAAAYFGVTRFHAEQENNAVYQAHVLAVGEQIQSRHADITLNDAVFDGSSLSFALDISHRSGTSTLYLYPRVTAIQNGQQISTSVVGFQRISENQSVSSFSALYGGAFYDGILLNPADSGSFNLDVRLNDRIPNPDEPVQWSLDFDVLTPNFPIDPAQLTITEDGDSRILTWDNMERDCLTAYQNGQILTDGLDSLFSYALYLPVPSGMTEDEWEQTDLENRLILSGAFDLSERLHCNFSTQGVRVASLTEPKTFSVGDYTCTLTRLDVTFAQLDYEMTVSHSGSSTAANLFTATDRTLQFLLSVPEGDAILSFTDSSIEDDGTVSLSGNYILTQPVDSVIFTPVFPDHLTNENEWMFEGYQPTEEEKAAAVTVDIE